MRAGSASSADAGVSDALDFYREAVSLVADEEGGGAAPVYLPGSQERLGGSGGVAGAGGHYTYTCGAELFNGGSGRVTG